MAKPRIWCTPPPSFLFFTILSTSIVFCYISDSLFSFSLMPCFFHLSVILAFLSFFHPFLLLASFPSCLLLCCFTFFHPSLYFPPISSKVTFFYCPPTPFFCCCLLLPSISSSLCPLPFLLDQNLSKFCSLSFTSALSPFLLCLSLTLTIFYNFPSPHSDLPVFLSSIPSHVLLLSHLQYLSSPHSSHSSLFSPFLFPLSPLDLILPVLSIIMSFFCLSPAFSLLVFLSHLNPLSPSSFNFSFLNSSPNNSF